jgi:hypothetical protein
MTGVFHSASPPKRSLRREDVREAHQLDELEERRRRVHEVHAARPPAGRELKARESLDAHRVRLDTGDVTTRELGLRG